MKFRPYSGITQFRLRNDVKKLFRLKGSFIDKRSELVKNVLTGRLPPPEYLEKYLKDNEINFKYNGFQSMIVAPYPANESKNLRHLAILSGSGYFDCYMEFCIMAENFFRDVGDLFFTVLDGMLGILINYPLPDISESASDFTIMLAGEASRFLKKINDEHSKKLVAAIGPAYQDIYFAGYSTTAAEGLIDYLIFSGLPGPVLTKSDIGGYEFPAPDEDRKMELEIRYHYLASEGMFHRAKEVLNEIVDIEQSIYILPFYKICANVVDHINYLFLSNGINSTNTHGLSSEFWKTYIIALRRSISLEELKANITNIFELLESGFEREPAAQSNKTERFTQYIDTYYQDPDLNVETLCRHFEINPSYLSRIFKKELGKGVLEYIHLRRINKAKRLLSDSDMHISEISTLCGFWGKRAFDTVFKRVVGITPNQYRSAQEKQIM